MEKVLDHRAKILTLLLSKPMYFEELMTATGFSSPTVKNALDKLIEAGLIINVKQEPFVRRRYVKLTDKGAKVAAHLEEVRKIIEEE